MFLIFDIIDHGFRRFTRMIGVKFIFALALLTLPLLLTFYLALFTWLF